MFFFLCGLSFQLVNNLYYFQFYIFLFLNILLILYINMILPKDLFFSLKRPKFALNLQKFALNYNTDRGHPATFRRVIQPSAGSRAVISTREQSRRAECASHGARLQRPGPQNGPAL